jgi:triacylglycerol lipase
VGPDTAAASREVFARLHEEQPYDGVALTRDVAYGPHERHRLDIFAPPDGGDRAVIVFVHGGGFVGGDKSVPDTPYSENVGVWACRAGFVGVTMNYRLAPEHRFPSGSQDVAAAVAWLRAHVGDHGGDPDRIVLMGASAGATHVAGYAAMPELHPGGDPGVRGLVLLSGAYDLLAFDDEAILGPYFGERGLWADASPLPGLVASRLPVMAAVAEHDPPVSHRQAALLFAALVERDARVPHLVYLPGHNHFTEVLHFNTDDRLLGDHIVRFAGAHAAAREPSAAT